MKGRWSCCLLAGLILSAALTAHAESSAAELKISGYGFLDNRKLTGLLKLLLAGEEPEFFDANFIEDSVVVLRSELEREGHLRPEISARVALADGEKQTFRWTNSLSEPLPRGLRARQVHFRIREGVRYHFRFIEFQGLENMERDTALNYFVNTRGLLKLAENRIYTPGKARGSAGALREALEREGFQNASVTLTNVVRDERRGYVDLTVQVVPGLRSVVRSVRVEEVGAALTNQLPTIQIVTNQPYSRLWLQDFEQRLVRRRYREGYPDAKADITVTGSNRSHIVTMDLLARVFPGPQVRVGDIRFGGEQKTKESAMRSRIPFKPGQLLDRTAAEQGRFRLARLGVFDSVGLRYEEAEDGERDVIYEVKEGKELDFTLLAGFGSYELLRGGFIFEQRNVWGLAHNSRVKLVQSFKSSSGDYTYTIPQFGWGSDVFFNASGLTRDEMDFTREELSSSLGARRRFAPIATDASLRYSYQYLNVADARFVTGFGVPNARVAAVVLDLRHDRRDNPIAPRRGHKIFTSLETASEMLGGEVDYQRGELHAAYHWPIANDRWIHVGASHGAILSDSEQDLPFNKRFFPGGESSIRGYQDGEASPRNAAGKTVGAESYLGTNLELEQALTPMWSLVAFFDAMGVAREIEDYPYNDLLLSVGGGLRWNTLIGPVRLEYGHNLRRRPDDPVGTLHVSIGFPF